LTSFSAGWGGQLFRLHRNDAKFRLLKPCDRRNARSLVVMALALLALIKRKFPQPKNWNCIAVRLGKLISETRTVFVVAWHTLIVTL